MQPHAELNFQQFNISFLGHSFSSWVNSDCGRKNLPIFLCAIQLSEIMSVSVLVRIEHAGFNEAVLLRMSPRELRMNKETINQWQKRNDKSGNGRSKEEQLQNTNPKY